MVELTACTLDLETGTLTRGAVVEGLPRHELAVLRLLHARSRQVVSAAELARAWDPPASARAVGATVARIRRRIEADPKRPWHLLTVPGAGWRFEPLEVEGTGRPRPSATPDKQVHVLGDLLLDLEAGFAERGGLRHPLSPTEVRLLRYLLDRRGRVVPAEALLAEVWGYREGVESRTLDTTLGRLRRKIEEDPGRPQLLLRVRGRGVRLNGVGARLPVEEPSFGREAVLDEVLAVLSRAPVVGLTGPGGIGKSHLARRVVRALDGEPDHDGHLWCDLGGASSGRELCRRVARSLAHPAPLPPHLDRALEGLGRVLALRGRLLVVLDAVEGLVDPVGRALEVWQREAPELRFLLTGRILPEGAGRSWRLGPLDEVAARALVRAQGERSGARWGREDEASVGVLVARADGVPLTLELLAARAALVGVDPLAALGPADLARIDRPHAEARLGSLEASLEVSWSLLGASLRRDLAALAFFVGPVDLTDAAAVGVSAEAVAGLRRHSLLVEATGAVSGRLTLLDTVRALVLRKLDPAERADHEGRWAEAVVDRAEALGERWRSGEPAGCAEAWRSLAVEIEGLAERDTATPERLARLIVAMEDSFALVGLYGVVAVLVGVLGDRGEGLLADRARLMGACYGCRARLEPEAVAALARRAEAEGDVETLRWTFTHDNTRAQNTNEPEAALAVATRGVEAMRRDGSPIQLARALSEQAIPAAKLGREAAVAALDEASALVQRDGGLGVAVGVHSRLSFAYTLLGHYASARVAARRAVGMCGALGTVGAWQEGICGWAELQFGHLDAAERRFRRSLEVAPHAGFTDQFPALRGLAAVAIERGDLDEASDRLDVCEAPARAARDENFLRYTEAWRGFVAHAQGAHREAARCYARAWGPGGAASAEQAAAVAAAAVLLADPGEERDRWTERLLERTEPRAREMARLVGLADAAPLVETSFLLRLVGRLAAR